MSKAEDLQSIWSYCPLNTNGNDWPQARLINVVVQIFGKKVADQCTSLDSAAENLNLLAGNTVPSSNDKNNFELRGLVVSPECTDLSLVSNIGQFISVDSRPLSCRRGVFPDLIKCYQEHVRGISVSKTVKRITNPLIVLDIKCPRASYNVDIEPAKDDILFHDTSRISRLVQETFRRLYGAPKLVDESTESARDPAKESRPSTWETNRAFSMSVKDRVTMKHSSPPRRNVVGGTGGSSIAKDLVILSPYDENEIEIESSSVDQQNTDACNPWVFAKLNSASRGLGSGPMTATPRLSNSEMMTPAKQRGDVIDGAIYSPVNGLQSQHRPEYVFDPSVDPSGKQRRTDVERPLENPGPGSSQPTQLDTWLTYREPSRRPSQHQLLSSPEMLSHRTANTESDLSSSPFSYRVGSRRGSLLDQQNGTDLPKPYHTSDRSALTINPDLAETLDYELRKQKATQQHRKRLRKEKATEAVALRQQSEIIGQRTLDKSFARKSTITAPKTPHQSRHKDLLTASHSHIDSIHTAHDLPPSTANPTTTRSIRKSLRLYEPLLPIDSVDEDDWVDNLCLNISLTTAQLSRMFTKAAELDDYINQGPVIDAFANAEPDELVALRESVTKLVIKRYRRQRGAGVGGGGGGGGESAELKGVAVTIHLPPRALSG